MRLRRPGRGTLVVVAGALALITAAALTVSEPDQAGIALTPGLSGTGPERATGQPMTAESSEQPAGPTVALAFAGDMHFQLNLAALLDQPKGALGAITSTLREADLTMVNLESAIGHRGSPEAKEREAPALRFHFRTSPAALDLLEGAGIDIVSMANNHGADYGPLGLVDTLRAIRRSPIPVLGIGRNQQAAFTPYRVLVGGTPFAYFAADASFREGVSSVWAAGPATAGIAAARAARPRVLLAAVRSASDRGDVVVVFMHWGKEQRSCPTEQQQTTAQALAEAGADIIVGSHAHVLLGSGWLGDTYVSYGLGNLLWYHNHQPDTGVLQLRVQDGAVVQDALVPARLATSGIPKPLHGKQRAAAVAEWRALRGCAGLASRPSA
jgi:poly-gamma-glutamate capsule biosynthesis protein CapA/YwtB (metallophosphatase superfamily)